MSASTSAKPPHDDEHCRCECHYRAMLPGGGDSSFCERCDTRRDIEREVVIDDRFMPWTPKGPSQ